MDDVIIFIKKYIYIYEDFLLKEFMVIIESLEK